MNALLAATRSLYFLGAIVLFGDVAFRAFVERAALRGSPDAYADVQFTRRTRTAIVKCALAAVFASTVLWFLAEASVMSGMPLTALSPRTLHSALFDTGFGRVSVIRFALAVAFAAALALAHADRQGVASHAGDLIALGLLSSVAWTGHANVEQGLDRIIHLSADVMHLLAAGAWVGALPALAAVLLHAGRTASGTALGLASLAARRFSVLGMASVGTLILTGMANACYTVATLPALVGTEYGRLLVLKLALFSAMLLLASINRFRYTPELAQHAGCPQQVSPSTASYRLGASAIGEIVLGVGVLSIVGTLGITAPATHVQTVWPFAYTLSWEAAEKNSVTIALCLALFAAAMLLAINLRHRRRFAIAWSGGVTLASLSVLASLLAAPAHPSTYFRSSERYSAGSVASGAKIYAERCSICHGPRGHGDGPAAATLPERPANLAEHVLHHREGDVLWWIKHGIPDTPMPAFDGRIPEARMWDVINLLRAQAEAEGARRMGSAVQSWAIEAPNFTFQVEPDRQESLSDQRGRFSMLVVFFDPAESVNRVLALSKSQGELYRAGLRVLAIPTSASGISPGRLQDAEFPIIARFDPRVAAVYAIFAPEARVVPKHVEFLIDRLGYIRARWTPQENSPWTELPYLNAQVLAMDREKPRPSVHLDHAHLH